MHIQDCLLDTLLMLPDLLNRYQQQFENVQCNHTSVVAGKASFITYLMSKASTIKEALKRWEDRTKENSLEAKVIELQFQWLPIEKMDNTLSTLVMCE